jgi:hypothetical protein
MCPAQRPALSEVEGRFSLGGVSTGSRIVILAASSGNIYTTRILMKDANPDQRFNLEWKSRTLKLFTQAA